METNLILYILVLIIPIGSQLYIRSTYNKYKAIISEKKLSGFEIARAILDANGLSKVHIVEVKGTLNDHYDSRRKVVRLSSDIFHKETIASAAIAAHEVGHAIQDKEGYTFLKIRAILFPFINVTSYVAYILLIVSLFLEMMNLFWLSIGLMLFSLLFQLVTLPVEFNASKRAKEELKKHNLVTTSENDHIDIMLKSAALTYVASLAASLLNVLRLILVFSGRRD